MPVYLIDAFEKEVMAVTYRVVAASRKEAVRIAKEKNGNFELIRSQSLGDDMEYFEIESCVKETNSSGN